MILSSSIYEKTYSQGSIEEVLEAIQVSSFKGYPENLFMVRSPLQSSSLREKENKEVDSHKAYISTFSCGCSSLIYRHLVQGFFIKTLIIMFITTNIHRPYVCDPLGPYILLCNNYIDPITPYWLTLVNYPHQHID